MNFVKIILVFAGVFLLLKACSTKNKSSQLDVPIIDISIPLPETEQMSSEPYSEKYEHIFAIPKIFREQMLKNRMLEHLVTQNVNLVRLNSENGDYLQQNDIDGNNAALIENLLKLDPNNDGKLTADEIEHLVTKSFATADEDNDKRLSNAEHHHIRLHHDSKSPEICKLPDIPEDLQFSAISIYGGDLQPDVTTAGQKEVVQATRVFIHADNKPTYLLLISHEPVIWELVGNTNSIKQVSITSFHKNENDKTTSGIVGINKDNITFMQARCLDYFQKPNSKEMESTRQKIKVLSDRYPDVMSGGGGAIITIKNDDVEFSSTPRFQGQNDDKDIAPEGFNEYVWKKFLRYKPDGIREFNIEDVIADGPVEKYKILPREAGIAQLIDRGFIKIHQKSQPDDPHLQPPPRIPPMDIYKLVKEIPHWPIGLHGGHLQIFIVGKGIIPPKYPPGHSCVIIEETKRAVNDIGCPPPYALDIITEDF